MSPQQQFLSGPPKTAFCFTKKHTILGVRVSQRPGPPVQLSVVSGTSSVTGEGACGNVTEEHYVPTIVARRPCACAGEGPQTTSASHSARGGGVGGLASCARLHILMCCLNGPPRPVARGTSFVTAEAAYDTIPPPISPPFPPHFPPISPVVFGDSGVADAGAREPCLVRLSQGERRLFVGTASLLQSWHLRDRVLSSGQMGMGLGSMGISSRFFLPFFSHCPPVFAIFLSFEEVVHTISIVIL